MIEHYQYKVDFSKLPVNICVVTFSSEHNRERDHYPMISRCLNSILENTNPDKYRLHVGCNNLSPRAMEYIDMLVADHGAVKYIGKAMPDRDGNTVYPKYPLMRQIYGATDGRNSSASAADWVIWFDDDSFVTKKDWLDKLEKAINSTPWAHQFGRLRAIRLGEKAMRWAGEASWFNPEVGFLEISPGNGSKRLGCNFISGGFYALSRHAINTCAIPDERLFHNRGDWLTGLALLHKGLGVCDFTYGVNINVEARRGIDRDCKITIGIEKD